jgi:hypothetical protein
MPRESPALQSLPAASSAALRKLGGDLATARKRRKQSLASWSVRLQVSVPTLRRMESGDAAVSMGVYATALWLINRHEALAQAADPELDRGALEADVRRAQRRQGARRATNE